MHDRNEGDERAKTYKRRQRVMKTHKKKSRQTGNTICDGKRPGQENFTGVDRLIGKI